MPKPNPAAELAARIVEALTRWREQSAEAYPPTLPELAAQLDPPSPPELCTKAIAKKPFAETLLRAQKKNANSLVALAEDVERLAADPRLLDAALGSLCTAEKPLVAIAKVVGQVEKPLRAAFETVLRQHVEANEWPAGIGFVVIKNKPHLYLHRFPLPPDVEAQRAAWLLTTNILRELATPRPEGVWILRRLVERIAPAATPDAIRATMADKTLKARVVVALPNNLESPLAMAEEVPHLAASPLVLQLALASTRTGDNQAVKIADLKKKLDKKVAPVFESAVSAAVAAGTLPPSVGCLRIKKTPYLFLTKDVGIKVREEASPVPSRAPEMVPRPEVVPSIEDAFERLDREKGGHNLVSLVALREAVAAARGTFDEELQRLRRSGRITLGAAEGRHGLSAEEREAGIVEEGVLLLFVLRTAN
jgi:hypothetical protein